MSTNRLVHAEDACLYCSQKHPYRPYGVNSLWQPPPQFPYVLSPLPVPASSTIPWARMMTKKTGYLHPLDLSLPIRHLHPHSCSSIPPELASVSIPWACPGSPDYVVSQNLYQVAKQPTRMVTK